MVDPVNLNVPGLPYLLVALAFLAVVALLTGALSPLELALWHHRRSNGADGDERNENGTDGVERDEEGGDGDREGSEDRDPEELTAPETDRPIEPVRSPDAGVSPTTIYECRHCGTTLEAGNRRCPRCETSSIARYEIG